MRVGSLDMSSGARRDGSLEKDHREVSALEEEVEIVQAQQPLDAKDEEEAARSEAEGRLPFSKARCIALVLTVAGASFLNVSCIQW